MQKCSKRSALHIFSIMISKFVQCILLMLQILALCLIETNGGDFLIKQTKLYHSIPSAFTGDRGCTVSNVEANSPNPEDSKICFSLAISADPVPFVVFQAMRRFSAACP